MKFEKYLDYNPETGILTWKDNLGRNAKKGEIAGVLNKNGQVYVNFLNRSYLATKIAWYLFYGENPKEYIRHVNNVPDDNRICNLKKSLPGTSYHRNRKKFVSFIRINGKQTHLGIFETEIEAHNAYLKKLGTVA